jgi:hypothetical protein
MFSSVSDHIDIRRLPRPPPPHNPSPYVLAVSQIELVVSAALLYEGRTAAEGGSNIVFSIFTTII